MGKPITSKKVYDSARRLHKEPTKLLHELYNTHCDPNFKLDLYQFELHLNSWLLKKKKLSLIKGSLTIIKYFDSKFGSKQ